MQMGFPFEYAQHPSQEPFIVQIFYPHDNGFTAVLSEEKGSGG